MAQNPAIYNDGGIFRFRDFLSQIPDFLKSENDVIVLLQLFSDYINNAYRNITVVKEFEFKLISVESRVGVTEIRLNKLAKLFKETEYRNKKIVYLAKPVSTPVTSNDYFLGIFEHTGTIETLSPAVITFTLSSANDGNRAYIEFTKNPQNSGVYVYNYTQNTLTLDPFNTSQDPFLNTPNKPIPTIGGLAPRMIEFDPSDISNISTRKIKQVGNTIYYETYFTATLKNIESIASIEKIEPTAGSPYLIDYYKSIDILPSNYKYRYAIDFPIECSNFDWESVYQLGNGLFYARDLTQYTPEKLKNSDNNNIYVDPSFNENKTDIDIVSIHGDGTTVTIVTKTPHTLNVGSRFNIQNTTEYNDFDKTVSKVINIKSFQYLDAATTNPPETSGNINIPDLSYYKMVNKKGEFDFYLKIPYKDLEGTTEFAEGDKITRLVDRNELEYNTFNGDDINIVTFQGTKAHYITVSTDPKLFKLSPEDNVTLRGSGSPTFPAGITKSITSLTYSTTEDIATAICSTDHNMRTGFRVSISGATQTEYNGIVEITRVDATTFTYIPITEPTVTTATGTITVAFGLTEGELYTIADIDYDQAESNTYKIKLLNSVVTGTGSGKIDIVKLNVYFNGVDDVNTVTNEITLHGGPKIIGNNKKLSKNGITTKDISTLRPSGESVYRHYIFTGGVQLHYVNVGDKIRISGATQSDYNGIFTVTKKLQAGKIFEIIIPDVTTLKREYPTNAQLQFPNIIDDPLDDLQEGDAIKIRGGGSLTVPTPLSEDITYNILEIDRDNNRITLSTDGSNVIEILTTSPGTFDLVKLNKLEDIGIIRSVDIETANDTGHIILEKYNGDFISKGTIGKITDKLIDFRATIAEVKSIKTLLSGSGVLVTATTEKPHEYITGKTVVISGANEDNFNGSYVITVTGNKTFTYVATGSGTATGSIKSTYFIDSTSTAWESGVDDEYEPMYKKNDFIVYDGIRYKLENSIIVAKPNEIGNNVATRNPGLPDKLSYFYKKDMDDITIPTYNIEKNPYMFGLFKTKSLAFDEEPDFNSGYDDLALNLYVRQIDQLDLIYGHDQREWFFDPRVAPPNKVERNGFLEILKGVNLSDDIVNIDAESYVKSNAEHPLFLEGTELNITRTVSSLTYSDTTELATAVCSSDHRLKSGVRVTIAGATQTEYNGTFQITIVSPNTFTYEPTTEPTATPATTGSSITASFDNTIVFEITSLTVESTTSVRVVTTSDEHGLKNGSSIAISGATETDYDAPSATIVITDSDPANEFVYTVTSISLATPAESPTDAIATYQPLDGDYINATAQLAVSDRGIYTARNREWFKFDDTKVLQNTSIFMQQNIFDVSETNPTIAKGKIIEASLERSGNEVTVTLSENHDYSVGSTVNIANASQTEYNGRFSVTDIDSPLNANQFKYKLRTIDTPVTPATPAINKRITCQSDKWYRFDIREIQWQKLSNALTYTTVTGNREYFIEANKAADEFRNNVTTLSNEFTFSYVQSLTAVDSSEDTITLTDVSNFEVGDELVYTENGDSITGLVDGTTYTIASIITDANKITLTGVDISAGSASDSYFTQTLNIVVGDLVNVNDQIISSENGKYRVEKSTWKRLSTKIAMKVRDITVDYRIIDTNEYSEDPYLYNVYNETEVDAYIAANFSGEQQVYKTYNTLVTNFQFLLEKIDNMDTTAPMHKMYNAKFDKNTVADRTDMDSEFLGVADIGYPLTEKIERLAYLKDPDVIDFEFITTLAKYMGYDMTPLTDDIAESIFYKTDKEKQTSIRKILSNLPYFNALRASKPGLEALLLTFGLVGKVVTMWTDANEPYKNFTPDYMIREVQYAKMYDNDPVNLIPTPHFKLDFNIEGNFDNQMTVRELKRLTNNIEIYKPINTVFEGIISYFEITAKMSMYAGKMKAIGRMQADVGYEGIEFDYGALLDSDCI